LVTFLGTSDGHPSPDRQNTSLLLRLAGQTILLDCGQPCSHTLKKMKVDFNSIDAVFVTHAHSDHIGGLPMLLQSLWLEKRTRPLPLYLPPGILEPLRTWLRTCYLFEENFQFVPNWQGLTINSSITVGPVTARVFESSHLAKTRARFAGLYPGLTFEAFSLALEANGKRFGFSGDLGDPQDLAGLCAQPLDLLVVELAHFHPSKLAGFLKDKPIAHVAVTHLSQPVRDLLPEVRSLLAGALPAARISFVSDGDVIEF
jgi:ribonuclease BN (tRNA processing enzyme)